MDAPLARQFRFVRELEGELIILDDQHDVAHQLTREAASVWRACDGRRTPGEIADCTRIAPPRVDELLGQLDGLGLLTADALAISSSTRRTILRKAVLTGAVVAGVPAITSALVPGPEEAFASGSLTSSSSSSSNPPPGPEPLTSGSSSPTGGSGVTVTPGKGGSSRARVKGANSRRRRRASRTGAPGGRALGGGPTGRIAPGTLPFTGAELGQTVAAGAALVAAGTAGRAALRRSEPAE